MTLRIRCPMSWELNWVLQPKLDTRVYLSNHCHQFSEFFQNSMPILLLIIGFIAGIYFSKNSERIIRFIKDFLRGIFK